MDLVHPPPRRRSRAIERPAFSVTSITALLPAHRLDGELWQQPPAPKSGEDPKMARKFVLIAAATLFALASTLLPTGGSQQLQTEPLPPAWIEHLDVQDVLS
jgi:hypothetical protein